MDGRVWLASGNPEAIHAVDVDDPARVARTIATSARVTLGSADRNWLWTAQFDTGVLERRTHDGDLVARVSVVDRPTGLILDAEHVWINPQHSTDPVMRVDKASLVPTTTRWNDFGHVVHADPDSIWLAEHHGFDDSTLVRVDRATTERHTVASGPNAGPYLFIDGAVWVAEYPERKITIFDRGGAAKAVLDAPMVYHMEAAGSGVFLLSIDADAFENRIERRTSCGEVTASIVMPRASTLAAASRGIWLTVADPTAHRTEIVTLEPQTLEVRGRVAVPGDFPNLITGDPDTSTSRG